MKGVSSKKVLRLYDNWAVFESLDTGNCLVISQIKEGTRDIKVCDRKELPDASGPCQTMPIEAIFGIYDLFSGSYAALVVESEPFVSIDRKGIPLAPGANATSSSTAAASSSSSSSSSASASSLSSSSVSPTTTPGINIHMRKAKKILVVSLFRNSRALSESKQRDEDRFLQLLQMSFSIHHFFFSPTFDVTLTQQRIAQLTQRQLADPIWARADHRFFWNREVISELIAIEADEWITPFMSAFVEVQLECEVEGSKFTMLFISRRSRYRQGCRFTRRGIDENGHAANFVETEQMIIHSDNRITSYVQIRGSIPVHWSSPVTMKYDPVVYIEEDRSEASRTVDWAHKHISELVTQYADAKGSIIFINLVDQKKDQGRLGVAFKEVVDLVRKKISSPPLHYVWFDFHQETKQKGKWKNLSKLITQVDENFRKQKFFARSATGAVTSWQLGVIRTNCMDNLDRTNVVQSLFARRSLLMQLGKDSVLEDMSNVLDSPYKTFEKKYKSVWANNADAISQMYAGTGALKVDFTKTGKRTIKGMFNDGVNSMKRYYINNFTDGIKQDAIDLMLGNYHPDTSTSSPFTLRPGQESLSANITKGFVLMMVIFSTLLLVSPRLSFAELLGFKAANAAEDSHMATLKSHFMVSLGITLMVIMYVLHSVVKKGSKIGERIVVLPCLLHEPRP